MEIKEIEKMIRTDVETCKKLVTEVSANYSSKHAKILGASIIQSVNRTVDSIIYSSQGLNGEFIICDEINPLALTKYLIKLKRYNCSEESLFYYVSFYLKRKINAFYRELKNGVLNQGNPVFLNEKELKKYIAIRNDRLVNGARGIRSR